jgi:hypothetical protein
MNFTNLVRFTGVIQDTFGSGRLSCINVRHDSDVTVEFKVDFAKGRGRCLGFVDILRLFYNTKSFLIFNDKFRYRKDSRPETANDFQNPVDEIKLT